jgi:hypothetical protein
MDDMLFKKRKQTQISYYENSFVGGLVVIHQLLKVWFC